MKVVRLPSYMPTSQLNSGVLSRGGLYSKVKVWYLRGRLSPF